jgi:ADP-ribose pyrophosphatase YjhB (NUDIX family)
MSDVNTNNGVLREVRGSHLLVMVRGRVGLISERVGKPFGLPGGKREDGESDRDALNREIMEELDHDITCMSFKTIFKSEEISDNTHWICTVFVADADKMHPNELPILSKLYFQEIGDFKVDVDKYVMRVLVAYAKLTITEEAEEVDTPTDTEVLVVRKAKGTTLEYEDKPYIFDEYQNLVTVANHSSPSRGVEKLSEYTAKNFRALVADVATDSGWKVIKWGIPHEQIANGPYNGSIHEFTVKKGYAYRWNLTAKIITVGAASLAFSFQPDNNILIDDDDMMCMPLVYTFGVTVSWAQCYSLVWCFRAVESGTFGFQPAIFNYTGAASICFSSWTLEETRLDD